MTDARAIIATIRDGGVPSGDDLRWFAAGLASGTVSAQRQAEDELEKLVAELRATLE